MNDMKETLPRAEWLDQQAELEPEREYTEEEKAIAAHKQARKKKEAQMRDVLSSLKIKAIALEQENREESEYAAKSIGEAEKELISPGEADESEIMRQITLDLNLAIEPMTVTGGAPGHYYDHNPYHCWHRSYTHNEGGVTIGNTDCSLAARKMHVDAHARGDGSGIADDNYVTSWVKLYYALWPTRNGHVRAFVPYTTRGWYRIYANDKWYNSKEAKIDLDVHVQLYQNFWGGYVKDDVFHLSDDNIDRSGRIDLHRSLYSGGMAVGANKWVIAEVAVKAYVYTSGSGSTARLNFWSPDYIFVPYVRFDFS